MKRDHQDWSGRRPAEMAGKGKFSSSSPGEQKEEDVDELLAALGYKVRSSDMADVAQKLEQLEMAMDIGGAGVGVGIPGLADDGFAVSDLSNDTVHYNPSDLTTWVDSMLSEINAPPPPLPSLRYHVAGRNDGYLAGAIPSPVLDPAESSTVTTAANMPPNSIDRGGYNAKAEEPTPREPDSVFSPCASPESKRDRKRMRTTTIGTSSSSSSSSSHGGGMGLPVVVVDAQEAGIRLVHTLMACSEAVQNGNLATADALVKQISLLASSQGGAISKVAAFFGEALARRIYSFRPPAPLPEISNPALGDLLHAHFYETGPYLKFAHFTANQAILEAFAGCRRVHVVDFGIKQGMQWPPLLQALALRPGGAPSFRLTGIGPSGTDSSTSTADSLQRVGWKLSEFARTIGVDFHYRGLVAGSLADLDPRILSGDDGNDDEEEIVAINSILELHGLLAVQGAIEKVLAMVKSSRPKILTVVEQEANHNTSSFHERFTEALHYYSTMFDSLESGHGGASLEPAAQDNNVFTEMYLGGQICNVVACEGADRTERHETLVQWRSRLTAAGFEPFHLGSNAFKQASTLLALFAGGDGYLVEERDGCLTLGWHTRPLIATSAWRVAATENGVN